MSGVQGSGVDLYARARIPFVLGITGVNNVVANYLPSGFISLTDGLLFYFEAAGANTGAMTLNIGDGVARPMKTLLGAALIAGDVPAGSIIECFYDLSANYFRCQNSPQQAIAEAVATAAADATTKANAAQAAAIASAASDATTKANAAQAAAISTASGDATTKANAAQAAAISTASGDATTKANAAQAAAIAAGLGAGQTWQNFTASRAVYTTYTNSSGKPINVHVAIGGGAGSGYIGLIVGGSVFASTAYIITGSTAGTLSATVPAGATYRVDAGPGGGATCSLTYWSELRA